MRGLSLVTATITAVNPTLIGGLDPPNSATTALPLRESLDS
ncbi:MAG: hypothetical protein WEG36_08465 [Gemmatimonadota bacterium]